MHIAHEMTVRIDIGGSDGVVTELSADIEAIAAQKILVPVVCRAM